MLNRILHQKHSSLLTGMWTQHLFLDKTRHYLKVDATPKHGGKRTSRRPEYCLLRLLINLKNDHVCFVCLAWIYIHVYVSCSRHVECGRSEVGGEFRCSASELKSVIHTQSMYFYIFAGF